MVVEMQLSRNMLKTARWLKVDALEGDKSPFTTKRCSLLASTSGVSGERAPDVTSQKTRMNAHLKQLPEIFKQMYCCRVATFLCA